MTFSASNRRAGASFGLIAFFLSQLGSAYGAGVMVGNSTLIDTLDYSDTFTGVDDGGANAARVYVPAIQPLAAYAVENTYGNPAQSLLAASFSFASDRQPTAPGFVAGGNPYPTGITNASGAGSDTGFTQTGGGVDYGLNYGLRSEYLVQFDAVQTPDRIDISSGASVGIGAASSLSVFFRSDGSAALYNPVSTETALPFNTGINSTGVWHNYAVRFDQGNDEIEVYVDEVSKGTINLSTFAGGAYSGFSNAVVGVGGAGGDRTWTDNFQVGSAVAPPVPHDDPGNIAGLPSKLVSYWDFNEAAGTEAGKTLNFAYDRQGNNDGTFVGTATRTTGLLGVGAAQFNDTNGDGVNVGDGGGDFALTNGITLEAIVVTTWDGSDQAEFFRKEDGNNRILFSFQSGANINDASGQLIGTAGTPGISLGLNTGGVYGEMDIAFDGLGGRPTLAQVADGNAHHFVASFNPLTGVKEMYMDGQLIGFVDLGDNVALLTGGAAPALIGASGGSEPFAGVIDEMALYGEVLTQAEILQHYANFQAGASNMFVPEPGSLILFAFGLFGLAVRRRR